MPEQNRERERAGASPPKTRGLSESGTINKDRQDLRLSIFDFRFTGRGLQIANLKFPILPILSILVNCFSLMRAPARSRSRFLFRRDGRGFAYNKGVNVLFLGHDEVRALLPVAECIPLMQEALVSLAGGLAHQPFRSIVRPPAAAGIMGLMPAYSSGARAAFGLKAICVFPGNPARGMDSHQGVVLLFSAETGEPLAVVNASAVTAVRTAAVSGVATRALAREDAGDLRSEERRV